MYSKILSDMSKEELEVFKSLVNLDPFKAFQMGLSVVAGYVGVLPKLEQKEEMIKIVNDVLDNAVKNKLVDEKCTLCENTFKVPTESADYVPICPDCLMKSAGMGIR
jgi:hypothetical protein